MKRRAVTSNGWVDLVARGFVGLVMGSIPGMLVGGDSYAMLVRLGLMAGEPYFGGLVWFLMGGLIGMLLGCAWFLADLPVPFRRRQKRARVPPPTR